jgi:Uma2 family endonuclease
MATQTASHKAAVMKPRYDGKKLSLEKFFDFNAEDGFKYEWNNGFLEAREKMIKSAELYLVDRLQDVFEKTQMGSTKNGRLVLETVCPISEGIFRIPDLSVFTKEQIAQARNGEQVIPSFIIELISPSDRIGYYQKKINEYFLSGTKAVWLVFPKEKQIWSFTSPTDVKIHSGASRCSATPAVDDMVISPDDLFN